MKHSFGGQRTGGRPHERKFSGAPRKFGNAGGFGPKPEFFETVCANCSNPCRVPFRPNGSRPVLCGNCFKRDGASAGARQFGDRRPSQRTFGDSTERPVANNGVIEGRLKAIEQKLDMILEMIDGDDAE